MRIFIIGDQLAVNPSNDLSTILEMMGHEAEVFFPPADVVDIIQDGSFRSTFSEVDKADLVVGLGDLNSSASIFYGYAIGREKHLLTEHKYEGILPNAERVVGIANIIQWVVKASQ
jgi:hypothetical protein